MAVAVQAVTRVDSDEAMLVMPDPPAAVTVAGAAEVVAEAAPAAVIAEFVRRHLMAKG